MGRWIVTARLPALCIVIAWLGTVSSPLRADNTQAFLDGLRQRELHDVALDLLTALRDDPKTDKALRETLDYEFGVTLIGAARRLPLEQREQQLEKAREHLETFLREYPQHRLAESAIRNLTDLKTERGEALLNESRQAGKTPDDKRWLRERARAVFEESRKSLKEIDARLVKKKQHFNKLETDDPALIAQLHQLVGEMLLTRLSLSKTYYNIALTYEPGSREYVTLLREARGEFSKNYWKYSRWLGGYAFRLEQARCYRDLGEYDLALEILEALARPNSDDEDAFRRIRVAAAKMAMEIYLLPKVKQYGKAWEMFQQWEATFRRTRIIEDAIPELSYLGGEAALELARNLDGNDPNQSRLRNMYRKRANELITTAARYPGEYQLKARLKLNDPLLAEGDLRIEPPKNYEEARDRANLAWTQSLAADLKPEQVERLRAEAAVCLRYALDHPPEEIKIDELNALRFQRAYLDWIEGNYFNAAVVGEFLAEHYTEQPEGRKGAEIALAAYTGMLQEAPSGEDVSFETARITRLAEFAARHWPDDSPADAARLTLLRLAVAEKNPEKARDLLGRFSLDSPRRGEAELLAGQALWIEWLRLNRLPEDTRPGKDQMTKLLTDARLLLTEGIGRQKQSIAPEGEAPYALAAAALSLAQICLEQDQSAKAVEWLEDPKVGAYLLAKSDAAEFNRGNFRIEAFKAALRAFVAADRLEAAEQALEALEKAAPSDNLTQIYIALGRELESNFKQALAAGDRVKTDRAARGFDLFLTRIAGRPAEQITYQALLWVAETFIELGNSLSPAAGPLSPEGQQLYAKAAMAYGRIIDICRKDKEFAPREGVATAIQIRLARCIRRLGKYQDALDLLVEILAVNPDLLNAQIEASRTYQDWGTEQPGYYLFAIRGGRKTQLKNGEIIYLVWGWNRIAIRVQYSEPHKDTYYQAKYNQALCRLKYAMALDGKQKNEQLRLAESDILLILKLRPDMGGRTWYNQFDQVLKQIQAGLGVAADKRGLAAAEKAISGKT
ncbi:MAG: hypothetical protein GX594_10360 [Pirellulaceae bacterium]|nr:hypothetical protein [Pirellulaceae bacterium]